MKNDNIDEIKVDENVENNPFKEVIEEKSESATTEPDVNETEKLRMDYDNLNNQYLRLAADFDNYRKRQAQEREGLINYGKIEVLSKLIEVLDNFDRAEQILQTNEDVNCVKESFTVLHKQIIDSLEKMGLVKIETEGQLFDPNFHEAVMQTPTEEYPDQTVIAEMQKGYKLGDKVIRPSLVNVATNG